MGTCGTGRLDCSFEPNNPFEQFAVKTVASNGSTVGHLPKEIYLVTKFLMDRGAKVQAQLVTTNYRKSPLVQGGLEIACEVSVKMPPTVKNHMLIDKYLELVETLYSEPKEEVIFGSFINRAKDPAVVDFEVRRSFKKQKIKKPGEKPSAVQEGCRYIRQMFLAVQRRGEKQTEVIDIEKLLVSMIFT